MQLTRLKLNHFRGVKPGTELHFGPRFNVLLGVNATGKTTLLELIASILGDDLSAYAGEKFDVEFEFHDGGGGEVTNVWTVSWEPADTAPRAEVLSQNSRVRVVGLTVADRPALIGATARQPGFRGAVQGAGFGGFVPEFRFDHPDAIRMDEGVEALRALSANTPVGLLEGVLPLLLMSAFQGALEPGSAFAQWRASTAQTRMHSWLLEVCGELGFADIVFGLQRVGPKLVQVAGVTFVEHGGDFVPYRALSYGQKRLFTFFAHLARTPTSVREPVVADELTNGLHHKWIDLCVQKLSDRQSFLSSQAPLLLDKLPWDSIEDVQRMFIRCERNGREFVWRNLTRAEAEELHLSKEQGIESTSEILAREELW